MYTGSKPPKLFFAAESKQKNDALGGLFDIIGAIYVGTAETPRSMTLIDYLKSMQPLSSGSSSTVSRSNDNQNSLYHERSELRQGKQCHSAYSFGNKLSVSSESKVCWQARLWNIYIWTRKNDLKNEQRNKQSKTKKKQKLWFHWTPLNSALVLWLKISV